MKKFVLSLICAALGATVANASVTLDFSLARAFTSGGSQVAAGTVGILVANTGNGILPTSEEFVSSVLSVGSFIGDARILGVIQASDLTGSGDFGFSDSISITDLTGLTMGTAGGTTGTDLAFYWFPGITTVGATVGEGQSYGSYRTDMVDAASGSTMSYNMPADGGAYTLATLDTSLAGSVDPSVLRATQTAQTVPEPSRMLLLGLAMMGLIMRRRR